MTQTRQHGSYWHICFGRRVAKVRCWRSCLPIFLNALRSQKRVFLAAPGFNGEPAEARQAEVVAFWLPVGKNEGRVVLQFAGIDTISDAETLAGQDVIVPHEERLPLDDESVYISELIGCTVYNGSVPVGVVDDVQFAMTADGGRRLDDAAPLLAVTSARRRRSTYSVCEGVSGGGGYRGETNRHEAAGRFDRGQSFGA